VSVGVRSIQRAFFDRWPQRIILYASLFFVLIFGDGVFEYRPDSFEGVSFSLFGISCGISFGSGVSNLYLLLDVYLLPVSLDVKISSANATAQSRLLTRLRTPVFGLILSIM